MADVKRWYIDWGGIAHVVARENSGWVRTLCGSLSTGDAQDTLPTKPRVCRKCRQCLKNAIVVDPAARQGK